MSKSVVKAMAMRVVAVRAELSETERRTDAAGRAMVKALKKDLLILETRLAAAMG